MTARSASAQDAAALAVLAARTFPLACPPHVTAAEAAGFVARNLAAENFLQYLADPDRIVLVIDTGGELTGFAMLVFGEPADPDVAGAIRLRPTVELSKFYLAPEVHGTGSARGLMDSSLRAAAERGAAGVWLGVNEQNARAIRFYAKCGYETVGRKHFQVGEGVENDFVMERPTS